MDEINVVYEQCEDCYCEVDMMDIIVKETADGNCIYCPKCVEHHKFLEREQIRLCKEYKIDAIKYGKDIELQEKKMLRESKEITKDEKTKKRTNK